MNMKQDTLLTAFRMALAVALIGGLSTAVTLRAEDSTGTNSCTAMNNAAGVQNVDADKKVSKKDKKTDKKAKKAQKAAEAAAAAAATAARGGMANGSTKVTTTAAVVQQGSTKGVGQGASVPIKVFTVDF